MKKTLILIVITFLMITLSAVQIKESTERLSAAARNLLASKFQEYCYCFGLNIQEEMEEYVSPLYFPSVALLNNYKKNRPILSFGNFLKGYMTNANEDPVVEIFTEYLRLEELRRNDLLLTCTSQDSIDVYIDLFKRDVKNKSPFLYIYNHVREMDNCHSIMGRFNNVAPGIMTWNQISAPDLTNINPRKNTLPPFFSHFSWPKNQFYYCVVLSNWDRYHNDWWSGRISLSARELTSMAKISLADEIIASGN